MKKVLLVVFSMVLAATWFAGCASSSKKVAKKNDLPTWVVDESELESKKGIYGSGAARYADKSTSLKAARLQARGDLANKLGTLINNVERSNTDASLDGVDSSYQQELDAEAKQVVAGAIQKNLYVDDDGTYWVLMFMPYEDVLKNFKSVAVKQGNSRLERLFSKITVADLQSAGEKINYTVDTSAIEK